MPPHRGEAGGGGSTAPSTVPLDHLCTPRGPGERLGCSQHHPSRFWEGFRASLHPDGPGDQLGQRSPALHAPLVPLSPVDRSLQNLSLAQSLSLNLKNHYSLDVHLPSTSTPASILGSPVAPGSLPALGPGDSYLNLIGLERGGHRYGSKEGDECLAVLEGQDGLSRRVEGSEVSEFALLNGSSRQKVDDTDRGEEDR